MSGAIETLTAAVEAQGARIEALVAEVTTLREKIQPVREIYTLVNLAELPEAPSLKTLRNNPARQPRGGIPDGYAGSHKAWYRETVEQWRRQLSDAPHHGFARRRRQLGGAA